MATQVGLSPVRHRHCGENVVHAEDPANYTLAVTIFKVVTVTLLAFAVFAAMTAVELVGCLILFSIGLIGAGSILEWGDRLYFMFVQSIPSIPGFSEDKSRIVTVTETSKLTRPDRPRSIIRSSSSPSLNKKVTFEKSIDEK